jgi:hypothetical protein
MARCTLCDDEKIFKEKAVLNEVAFFLKLSEVIMDSILTSI